VQVFRLDHLSVCLVSKTTSGDIESLQVRFTRQLPIIETSFIPKYMQTLRHFTFVSVGNEIVVFNRNRIVNTIKCHSSRVLGMSIVGNILLSFDESNIIYVSI